MKAYIKTFTKEIASEIIEKQNTDNYRNLKSHVFDMYAKDMTEGRWITNGDTIRFDKNGVLLDGQHRLRAVIKSGIPEEFVVVEDLDPLCAKTIDIGHKRSVEDYLKRQEECYQKGATAVVKLAMALKRHTKQVGQSAGNGYASNTMVVDEYTKNKSNYSEATQYGKRVSSESKKVLKPSHVGAIYYYLVYELGIDKAYVQDFFFKIINTSRSDKSIYGKTYDILLDKEGKLGRSGTAIIGTYIRCWNAMIHKCTTRLQEYGDWFETPLKETVESSPTIVD